MKVAIIGSGIAGNVVAHHLHREHDITVYEAASHIGGHAHTHRVEQEGREYHLDTGFMVFNDRTYPQFVALLAQLGVPAQESCMSFSVRDERIGFEYNGTRLNTLFAQRRNLMNPSFIRMLLDILRFNRYAPTLLTEPAGELPLAELLGRGRYGKNFIEHYIVPMGAAIWSTDPASMLGFPARFFVRFLHNHGMLSVNDRPVWRTVQGGSARYVEALTAPFRDRIRLDTPVEWVRRLPGNTILKARGHEAVRYDVVFFACHSDQALALLAEPSALEREVLGAIPYQRNEAVLHTDTRLLPRRPLAWAAWNYHVLPDLARPVALTYNLSMLQRLETPKPFLLTLNQGDAIDPNRIIKRLSYDHPRYTTQSVSAQARQQELNDVGGIYYCGAWWRHGFHEDGVVSARQALAHFEQDREQRPLYRSA